jgi:hypothetical protein
MTAADKCRAFRITGRGEAGFAELPVEALSPAMC